MFAAVLPLLPAAWAAVAIGRGGGGPGWITFAIIGGIIAVALVAAYFSYLQEKKRAEALRQVAEELQFDFTPKGDGGLLGELTGQGLFLFSQGHRKKVYNVLRGRAGGLEVAIFDYDYTTGGGKNSHTHRQSAVAFRFDGPPLPAFSLRPENVWHKIGQLFGYQDIDFDEHPTFSSRYLLRGPDEAAVREVFTDEVLSFYEGMQGVSTEANGDRLLFYRHEKRVKPERIRPLLEEGFKILAVFRPPGEEGKKAEPGAE
jgi:hypothetical protein